MAKIIINTSLDEQNKVLKALTFFNGKTVSVSAIADKAGLNQNRVRYIITDLEELNKVKKVPTKSFNRHYVRYRYEVI